MSRELIKLHQFIVELEAQGYWGFAEHLRKILNDLERADSTGCEPPIGFGLED